MKEYLLDPEDLVCLNFLGLYVLGNAGRKFCVQPNVDSITVCIVHGFCCVCWVHFRICMAMKKYEWEINDSQNLMLVSFSLHDHGNKCLVHVFFVV